MKVPAYKSEKKRGEVTAFLALIFVLLVGFTGSMMESASLQSAKSYRRADMNCAMESVFAEYQRDMLEEFDLFVLDASYESSDYSEERIFDRLSYYGASGMEQTMKRVQLLTDYNGAALEDQIAKYMKSKYGLSSLNPFGEDEDVWKERADEAEESVKIEDRVNEELAGILSENEQELPTENNPLSNMQRVASTPLTELVMPEGKEVSDASVTSDTLVSGRTLQRGYGDFSDKAKQESLSKILLDEYLLGHFDTAVEEDGADGTLKYEMEYLLAGKNSDRENLNAVLKRLLMLRFAPNYAFLQQDAAKQAEAQSLALTLCSLIALPVASEAVAQALLLAWALGESVMDLRSLMKGGKVPLVKSTETWQLSLTGLMTLGTEDDHGEGVDAEEGLDYKGYLRGLLLLENKTNLILRTEDLIELCMRNEKGLTWFRADHCVYRMEVASTVRLRRGITYTFNTYYTYQ